ncbi:unnamed protein product, partial [Lymnaea stagnalis]
ATPEANAKATEACHALVTIFYRCHSAVDVNDYIRRCTASYCSSLSAGGIDAAQRAVCNVMSTYHKVCTLISGEAISWRSSNLCPKTCNPPFIFNGLITNRCPLTCGASMYSYTRSSCQSQPFGGCECPAGQARINNTCVAPQDCQCKGDDGRFYDHGKEIVSGDHCQICTCGNYGLWECKESPEKCSATCTILGGSLVKTFDGRMYEIKNSCGELTIAQGSDISIKLEVKTSVIAENGDKVSPSFITVEYQGTTSRLQISKTTSLIDNGFGTTVYIRQAAQNVFVGDIKGGLVRFIVSRDGTFHLKMKSTHFRNKVLGICGNLDNNKDNDFMSPSYSEMDNAEFIKFYSTCREAQLSELSLSTVNPLCSNLSSIPLPPNSRVDIDSYVKLCSNAPTNDLRCDVSFIFLSKLYWSLGDTICKRKQINLCDANCKDHLIKNCEPETIYTCGCGEGEYLKDDGTCVALDQCGCFDFTTPDKVIAPHSEFMHGCRECVCNGSDLICDNSCEEVICANSQASRTDLLAKSIDPTCARQMCPKPFYAMSECINVATSSQLCFCAEGFKQTQAGACVEKCPCYEGGRWYKDGETFEKNCLTKVCRDGVFVFDSERPTDCTGVCVLTGSSMKLKPFDTSTLSDFSIEGMCEYFVLKIGNDFAVKTKPVVCGSARTACMHMITIETPYMKDPIILKSTNPGTVMVGNKEYNRNVGPNIKITDTTYYLSIYFGDLFAVQWNQGLTMRIEVSSKLFNRTSGLCGNFNLDASDDRKGSDDLQKETISKLARSWIVNPDECTMGVEQSIGATCEGSKRQAWAKDACKVILEGEAFAACRKYGGEVSFYDNCVAQSCNCDTGGDCECLCDAISAYAAHCNEIGAPAKWRHQRLCPIQCEGGSIYDPCGSSCPEACGVSPNKTSTLCSSLTCLEGCYCPEGYVRSDLDDIDNSHCIPRSECPCVDEKGHSIPNGQIVTINCQVCECTEGELKCTGEPCKTECEENEYLCNDGHCIYYKRKCDGVPDCK